MTQFRTTGMCNYVNGCEYEAWFHGFGFDVCRQHYSNLLDDLTHQSYEALHNSVDDSPQMCLDLRAENT